jgi:hypothetical protein
VRADRERSGSLAGAFRPRFAAPSLVTTGPQFPTWTASPRQPLPSASPNQVWSSSSLTRSRRWRPSARAIAGGLHTPVEARGKSLGRPWALSTAAGCRAHLAASVGDLQQARAACEQAVSLHETLPMPLELGQPLLVKGIIERRDRRKSVARAALGRALSIFEQLGAPLWAGKVRREQSKIAVRMPPEGLTETEGRIARRSRSAPATALGSARRCPADNAATGT